MVPDDLGVVLERGSFSGRSGRGTGRIGTKTTTYEHL